MKKNIMYNYLTTRFLWHKADLPLESVILLIGGMALAVTGALLIPVSTGRLAYYEDGFFGLLLVVFSLQIITLGKTPLGDMRHSGRILGIGLTIAAIGIVTCFIPGIFGSLPRYLLVSCFGLGGAVQFVQLYRDKTKLRFWLRTGGILRHLAWACLYVYGLSLLVGLLLWRQPPLPTPVTAMLLFLFGCSVIYLAGVLRLVYRTWPESDPSRSSEGSLCFKHYMLLFTGIFMMLLGTLLIPVSLGVLSFSANAQLGLLMIIFSIQMLALGNTPLGTFPCRSWFMISLGLLFAFAGIVSCVIPCLLVGPLTILVGVLNLIGGLLPLLLRLFSDRAQASENPVHPLLQKLSRTQWSLNLLSILFGTSMLIPGLIPGPASGIILTLNGGVLLYLLHLLIVLTAHSR